MSVWWSPRLCPPLLRAFASQVQIIRVGRSSLGAEPTPLLVKEGMELMVRTSVDRDTSGSRASGFHGGFAGVCGASVVGAGMFAALPTAAAGVCTPGVAGDEVNLEPESLVVEGPGAAWHFAALPTATAGVCVASVVLLCLVAWQLRLWRFWRGLGRLQKFYGGLALLPTPRYYVASVPGWWLVFARSCTASCSGGSRGGLLRGA